MPDHKRSVSRPAPAPGPTSVRFAVLGALASAAIGAYVVRVCISPAGSTIREDLGFSDVQMGYILGGFFVGYMWFQFPAAWLGNWLGPRAALAMFSLLWSAGTLASAWSHTFTALWWSRIAIGVAQAGLFAVTIKALSDWFPPSRRGMASAVIAGCMSVGAVLASGLTVRLLGPLGWRGTFEAYAFGGILWSVAFYLWFRDTPEEHPGVNAEECRWIRGGLVAETAAPPELADPVLDAGAIGQGETTPASPEPAGLAVVVMMLATASMWALCAQAFFRAFGYAFFITWFPAYLERSYHVEIDSAGDLTMAPLVGVVLGSFLGGYLVDAILVKTGSKRLSRSGVAVVALGLCALSTLAAILVRDVRAAVAIISVGSLFSGLGGPTTWAATMDISGKHTAIGFSLMNMSGNLGAIVCPIVVGYLIAHLTRSGESWDAVLYLFAANYLAAAICWLLLDPNQSAVERTAKISG